MPMEIAPEDPRGHVDRRTYSRAIVPGTLPDQKKAYVSIVFRPDALTFSIGRAHSAGRTEPWQVLSVHLSGWRVLKSGKASTTEGQRYGQNYDLTAGRYDNTAPADVIEYVRLIVDSENAEGS
jgi:hypothetical protein